MSKVLETPQHRSHQAFVTSVCPKCNALGEYYLSDLNCDSMFFGDYVACAYCGDPITISRHNLPTLWIRNIQVAMRKDK